MAKNGKCKAGYYYCYTDEKCKPIPKGFKVVGRAGYLRKENGHSVDDENKNGNGNGNGNGHSNGNGNGGNGGGMSESKSGDSSLRDWFSKSKSSDGKPGWVQLGGKYAGKPCARQPGQTTKPKCGSSKMKRNLSKDEEERAFRRKNAKDPNPDRKGKAINVKTEETILEKEMRDKQGNDKFDRYKRMVRHKQDKYGVSTLKQRVMHGGVDHNIDNERKAKGMKEEFTTLPLHVEVPTNIRDFNLGLMFRESLDKNSGMLFVFDEVAQQSFHMRETKIPLDIAFIREDGIIESIKQLEPFDESAVYSKGKVFCALEVNRGWFEENNVEVGDQIQIEEGKKDACYHKVKSRYSVWPSAYASGALVKCRKVGAKNWGNKTKKEGYEFADWRSDFTATEWEFTDLITAEEEMKEAKKCWPGYKKVGTQKLFGKTYNRCVKAGDEVVHDGEQIAEKEGCSHTKKGKDCPIHGMESCPEEVAEATTLPRKTGQIIRVFLTFRGKMYIIQMFFPSVVKPSRAEVQAQIEKVYPGGKVRNYDISDYEPGEPLLHTEGAAWTKKAGKSESGGLNEKGRKSYERENPGSDLKAPSKKVGNPRRKSFCARMKGMKKKLTSSKTANDPDSRINKSLRAWNC
jgi:uncharacterized membrane protein (UPF0127 family)